MDAGWQLGPCDYPPSRRMPGPSETIWRRLEIKPQRPTLNMIRKMSTAESFKAGQACLEGVVPVGTDRGIFDAQVRDGKTYKVIAALGYGSGISYCTCPYDGKGACRHVVAALLYASANFDQLIRNENRRESGVEAALDAASTEHLKEFLAKETSQDEGLRKRFLARFGRYRTRPNVRADLDEAYYRMGDAGHYGGEIDFDDHLAAAKKSADKGDYDEAIRICQEISEAIQDNMENVDDSYAHYSTILDMAIDQMVDCIERQGLDHQQKRRHISYLSRRAAMDEYGCDIFYEEAVAKLCTSKEDTAYRQKLDV